MAKYLVTGGCGFIGSHLCDGLLEQGHEIVILDDLSTGKMDHTPDAATNMIKGSITNVKVLQKALEGVEGCFHLAAIPSIQKSVERWSETHAINLGGTVKLFEEIAKNPIPVIYASSSAVYGDPARLPLQEDDPKSPQSPYGADKLACELQARVAWNVFKIPNMGFRFFNVFGTRQDPSSPYSGVISLFTKLVREKKPLTIYGDGEQKRDFVYVKDVVRIMIESMKKGFQGADVYNLCSGIGTSVNELANLVGEIAGMPIEKEYKPMRPGEVRLSIGDPSKAERNLKLKSTISLKEGLTEILQNI